MNQRLRGKLQRKLSQRRLKKVKDWAQCTLTTAANHFSVQDELPIAEMEELQPMIQALNSLSDAAQKIQGELYEN